MLEAVGMIPWMGDQPVVWSLPAHRTAIKETQTLESTYLVELEFLAADCATAVIGISGSFSQMRIV
jgi:hypothetical protein